MEYENGRANRIDNNAYEIKGNYEEELGKTNIILKVSYDEIRFVRTSE